MPSSSLIALAAAVLHVPERPERILEIGCGDGEAVLFLAREYPSARVRGVDASAEAIREAVSRIGLDPEGRVAFKRGKARALPFPDGFFDLVSQAGGTLHPGEIARVLRPNGYLVLVGAWRWLDWRLGGHRFVPVESGEAEGERFHVLRLHTDEPAPE
ncbi:MAG TPA: class I SAM-dependent methyltransferase [Solirubrobacterales bacterium]|nr:class I SAM-dependent methyltransferase [Solirubrobacterales bacterium]